MKAISIHDKGLSVMEIMNTWPETIPVFIEYKMLCVGCSVGSFHTIQDACNEHDLRELDIRAALDAAVRNASALRAT
jgi:hybrid cluster-associated redox disulfide protein